MKIKRTHPFDDLKVTLNDLETSNCPFDNDKVLLILPDNISIKNCKNYCSRKHPEKNNRIVFETFESLGKKILSKEIPSPTVLENNYLKVFLVDYIEETKDTSVKSKKIYNIIENIDKPERSEIIENLSKEFLDYVRAVYPPSLHKEKEDSEFHKKLIKIARNLKEDNISDKSVKYLKFFKNFESFLTEKIDNVFPDGFYPSRAHLVGKATQMIKKNPEYLDDEVSTIEDIIISGISVFDTTIIEFVKKINEDLEKTFTVITGKGTHERTLKRFDKIFGNVKSEIKEKNNNFEVEKWAVPNHRRETEFVASLISGELDPEGTIVISRDSSVYIPYVEEVIHNFGLSAHIETRRYLSMSVPFRLVTSLLNLIEKNSWTVSDISNPLRLGFVLNYYGNKSPLPDYAFLNTEFWLNKKIKYKNKNDLQPKEWMDLFSENSQTRNYIEQLKNWKENVNSNNIWNKLIDVLRDFQKYANDVYKKINSRNGMPEDKNARAKISDMHITGDTENVIYLIKKAENFSDFLSKVRGKQRNIENIIEAFWIIGSGETYGRKCKDKKAIRFVDAANTFFVPRENRIIIGLNSGTFPKKPPNFSFLPKEFRKNVNSNYGQLYFQDPETDYENELDFFEAATGGEIKNKKVYHLNPYLDERGHRNSWSIFSDNDVEEYFITPSDFYFGDDEEKCLLNYKPKARWQKAIEKNKEIDNLKNYFEDDQAKYINNLIIPRLKQYNKRVKTAYPTIKGPDISEEPYLEGLINQLSNQPVPANEIDLWLDCPIKHYFYRFVFHLQHWEEDANSFDIGSRKYTPRYWNDDNLGEIPRVIIKGYLPSRAHKFIKNFFPELIKRNTSKKEIIRKINESNLHGKSKKHLNHLLDILEKNKNQIELGEDDWDWYIDDEINYCRPPALVFDDKTKTPGSKFVNHIHLANYPLYLYRSGISLISCQKRSYNYALLLADKKENTGNSIFYYIKNEISNYDDLPSLSLRDNLSGAGLLERKINNPKEVHSKEVDILQSVVNEIKNYDKIKGDRKIEYGYNDRKCDSCVYKTLCGDWGVF